MTDKSPQLGLRTSTSVDDEATREENNPAAAKPRIWTKAMTIKATVRDRLSPVLPQNQLNRTSSSKV
jgi:hypothetical protein